MYGYGYNPYAPPVVAGNQAAALALDAADGRIDGTYFGQGVAAASPYGYAAPVVAAPVVYGAPAVAPVYGAPVVYGAPAVAPVIVTTPPLYGTVYRY